MACVGAWSHYVSVVGRASLWRSRPFEQSRLLFIDASGMKIGLAFTRRIVRRRTLLKATPALALAVSSAGLIRTVIGDDRNPPAGAETEELRMADAPRTPPTKVTVERREQIVLIGIN